MSNNVSSPKRRPLPFQDLVAIESATQSLWEPARNRRFFITGGTGFFGHWLISSFHHINQALSLHAELLVLSRSPDIFLAQHPWYQAYTDIHWLKGDITSFELPALKIDYVIHGATSASKTLNDTQPYEMMHTIFNGTAHVLHKISDQPIDRFLFISSGAVYGRQPFPKVSETFTGDVCLKNPANAYAEGKRAAEMLVQTMLPSATLARCFAFVGPYLPLDTHFAIGNFIQCVLTGRDIVLTGDGTPYRSYLYPSDLCIWLWTLLFKGQATAYNVGSDDGLPLSEIAHRVKENASNYTGRVVIQKASLPHSPPSWYVPDITQAREQLGLEINISLNEAICRTLDYHLDLTPEQNNINQ